MVTKFHEVERTVNPLHNRDFEECSTLRDLRFGSYYSIRMDRKILAKCNFSCNTESRGVIRSVITTGTVAFTSPPLISESSLPYCIARKKAETSLPKVRYRYADGQI